MAVDGIMLLLLLLLFLTFSALVINAKKTTLEGFNDWGGRGYDDFVPGEVTKTTPSGDETS